MKYLYNYFVKSEADRRALKGSGKIEFNSLHDHKRYVYRPLFSSKICNSLPRKTL